MMLDDYNVPNKELRVAMSMRIDSAKLDGQTSATGTAHKGFKAKVFNVSLLIPFAEPDLLSRLIAVAQTTQSDGSLKVYTVTDELANAVKVRKVQFTDEFYVRDMDRVNAWSVQFALQDFQSVPEKVEQRQEVSKAPAQTTNGEVVAAENTQASNEGEGEPGWFERQLAKMDKALS
jgi:hypothetical protein